MVDQWKKLGDALNSSFFFVLDKLVSLEGYFIDVSYAVARVILLIALLSAGLNYALTGAGLKENLIKIMKATVFFLIIAFAYPRVVSWITKVSFEIAYGSVGKDVESYFHGKVIKMEKIVSDSSFMTPGSSSSSPSSYHPLIADFYQETKDLQAIFSKMTQNKSVTIDKKGTVTYTSIVPAAAIEVMLLVASDAFNSADKAPTNSLGFPDIAVIAKGLLCGFFIIFIGVFALLEYLMCMLEFALVSSVGVILLPASIWEGSKFITEGYIKAVIGFFLKLLLCTLAVYLLLYGFISILNQLTGQGFKGSADQFAFIIFTCLLFLFICKSAPGIAQSLVTGAPSLSASGAISAAGGAVAAAAATAGVAQKAVVGATKSVATAGATAKTVADGGGGVVDTVQSFIGSIAKDAGGAVVNRALGLTRSLGGGPSGGSIGGVINQALDEGENRGNAYLDKYNITPAQMSFDKGSPEAARRDRALGINNHGSHPSPPSSESSGSSSSNPATAPAPSGSES